jgi:hypothetical protein
MLIAIRRNWQKQDLNLLYFIKMAIGEYRQELLKINSMLLKE